VLFRSYNPVDGKLYVILGVTAQIKVIDPKQAAVVATFGGLGSTNSKFQGIGGLAFRKNGNILVLDHLMQAIKEFDPAYNYVATYVDVIERDALKLSSNLLSSFAFDEDDLRFYITSTMGNRVYKFDILPANRPAAIPPGGAAPKPGK
jgi:DNA-binding beta-propeller fold protein YncE